MKNSVMPNSSCLSNIQVFYHIYIGPERGVDIVKEQSNLMWQSGLMNAMRNINLTIIGTPNQREIVKQFFPPKKINIIHESEDGSCFEWPCLKAMRKKAENEEFLCCYFHTKCSSYTKSHFDARWGDFEKFYKRTEAWRHLMNYWIIERWHLAVNVLSLGYGNYGTLWKCKSPEWRAKPHFSGNFWWATSKELLNRHPLTDEYLADRMNSEYWNGSSRGKTYSAFDVPVLLYSSYCPPSLYKKPCYDLNNIKYIFYHFFHNFPKAMFVQ